MLDEEDRKIFIAFVFGHATGHNHEISLADIQIMCDQALMQMNEPITNKQDVEVIKNLETISWYSSHIKGENRETKRQTNFNIKIK